jgi:hypothetical protein
MLTSALPGLPLEEVARWAESAGYSARPRTSRRDADLGITHFVLSDTP